MDLPELSLADWLTTRNTLHRYCRLLGVVRRSLTPRQRHWSHVTLQVMADGLTTTTIPMGDVVFELQLDWIRHQLRMIDSRGAFNVQQLTGQSPATLLAGVAEFLREPGLPTELHLSDSEDVVPGDWDREAVQRFGTALTRIDSVFKSFKGQRRRETSPVQLFPHHLDLALSWYSGRLVAGQDPADEDAADEQVTLGFSTGDTTIGDPYFYAIAYPEPDGFVGSSLPAGAYWQTQGFSGAVLPYAAVVGDPEFDTRLREFLRMAHHAGASRMV